MKQKRLWTIMASARKTFLVVLLLISILSFVAAVSAIDPVDAGLDQTVYVGETVYFSGSAVGDFIDIEWNFGDGSPVVSSTDPSILTSTTHVYTAAGSYIVTLRVFMNGIYYQWESDTLTVTVLPPVNAVYGSTPTLDGVVDPEEEWDDAEKIVFAEGVYVKRNCSHLHIGFMIDYSAGPPGPSDRAVVLFDVNHDNGTTSKVDDLQLAIYYNGTLAELQGTGTNWAAVTPSGWQGYSATNQYSGDRCYEFSIPYSKIGVTSGEADILGIALGYYHKEPIETNSYWWPKTVANPNQPDSWTDIIFPAKPTMESCDSSGNIKNTFNLGELPYVKGSGYAYPAWILVTITKDMQWIDQMPIPVLFDENHIYGVAGFQSDSAGELIPSPFSPGLDLVPGGYDIVVDINDNGIYDECIDVLDDFDVGSAGFFVIPEIPLGTIMALTTSLLVLGIFKTRRTEKKQ